MEYKTVVPKKFWHDSEPTPVAQTVGELVDILNELPRELVLTAGFSDAAMVVLYNIDKGGMHVEIVEVDFDDDDEFGDPDEEDEE